MRCLQLLSQFRRVNFEARSLNRNRNSKDAQATRRAAFHFLLIESNDHVVGV